MQFSAKLKHLLLTTGVLLLSLSAAQGQDLSARKINLNINNASLETAFGEIQKQSGIVIAYGEDIEKYASTRVNIAADNISVRDAVARTIAGTNLRYTQQDGRVLIDENPDPSPANPAPSR